VSGRIAAAVIRYASENHLGRFFPDDQIDRAVEEATWYPEYVPVVGPDS
jgi:hypothetical protein